MTKLIKESTTGRQGMHIIHIMANNSTVPYFNRLAEGIGNYPDMKFSFIAMYPEKPAMIEEMKERNCDCYWIKFDHTKRKRSMITAVFGLYDLLKKLKPDAIHTHLFDDSLPALFAARLAGVKIRAVTKGDTAFHWRYNRKWVWMDRFNNANATHIIALCNESEKFIIEKEKAPANKVYVIHHGISVSDSTTQDEPFKQKIRKQYGLEGKIVIGTVSRFIEWKGYRYIVEAAKIITAKYKIARFLFIGLGEQRKEIEQIVKKLEMDEYITFAGRIEKQYMPSVFGLMDIYVHAAIMEPFGFVIAEAMANGIPLVTTKTGAAADVLTDKETCYFTEYNNPQSIADGIQWMIEHPAERDAMKEKIKKIAKEKFSVEKMLANYIKLYKGELRQ